MSDDEGLASLCREVLVETFGQEWTLALGPDGQDASTCDLCIWDFTAEGLLAQDISRANLKTDFFLVRKDALEDFYAFAGSSDANVLLKPVTRASLRAFLSGVGCEHRPARRSGRVHSVDALREERDQMLQFLIHANLKLQEYDQERTNFMARSVHDFRAPLTAVSGYCALALEEDFGPLTPELRGAIEKIQHGATRLSRITRSVSQSAS